MEGVKRENVCATMLDADFLNWVHDRLEYVHKENRHYDYMWRLREIAESLRPQPEVEQAEAGEAVIGGDERDERAARHQRSPAGIGRSES